MSEPSVSPADTIRAAEEWVGEFRDTWDWPRDPITREVDAAAAWTTLDEAATLGEEMAALAAALLAVGERDKAEIAELRGNLTMLRDAWNAHMDTCPQHAALPDLPAPTWDDLERWRNALSDTASGGSDV